MSVSDDSTSEFEEFARSRLGKGEPNFSGPARTDLRLDLSRTASPPSPSMSLSSAPAASGSPSRSPLIARGTSWAGPTAASDAKSEVKRSTSSSAGLLSSSSSPREKSPSLTASSSSSSSSSASSWFSPIVALLSPRWLTDDDDDQLDASPRVQQQPISPRRPVKGEKYAFFDNVVWAPKPTSTDGIPVRCGIGPDVSIFSPTGELMFVFDCHKIRRFGTRPSMFTFEHVQDGEPRWVYIRADEPTDALVMKATLQHAIKRIARTESPRTTTSS